MLRNKEYTSYEIVQTLEAMNELLDQLGSFLNSYVLRDKVPELGVDVRFVQGVHDLNTPTKLAIQYFDSLVAVNGKQWHVFRGCGHRAMYEDTEQFRKVLTAAAKV